MQRSKNVSSGFSLLELLVVMAVMGIMIGLVGFSFIGSGGGQIGQGQRLLLSLLHQVKTLAVSSGKEARLIVSADPTDEEKYLCYMEIVLQGDNNDTRQSWEGQGGGSIYPIKYGLFRMNLRICRINGLLMVIACGVILEMNLSNFLTQLPVNGLKRDRI